MAYVIYHGGWKNYQVAEIAKETGRLFKLKGSTGYDAQIAKDRAVLILENREDAVRLHRQLVAIADERDAAITEARRNAVESQASLISAFVSA